MAKKHRVDETEETRYNPNDPDHVSNRLAEAGRKDERIKAAYAALLSHRQGREMLWDQLTVVLGLYRDFTTSDPAILASQVGQHNAAMALRRILIKADVDMYALMEKEFANG